MQVRVTAQFTTFTRQISGILHESRIYPNNEHPKIDQVFLVPLSLHRACKMLD